MDVERDRRIIRLWNQLRLLQREGRPIEAVLSEIEKALAERDRAARMRSFRNGAHVSRKTA